VYLAAPDSTIDGVNVYKARVRMGEALAQQIKRAGIHIDSVIPIPDTGRPMAAGLASKLRVRYREGLIKNRYIHRTFIMPGQKIRKRSLHFKLHPIELEFKGKSVLLVDDSIVRGNTSKKIVELVREAGARKVYFTVAAPPIVSPEPYGIDLPTTQELIAANLSVEEIRKYIKADGLFYGTIGDLRKSIQYGNPRIKHFSEGCFTKKYPTSEVTPKLLRELGRGRNETRDRYTSTDEESDSQKMLALV
jgi:amidophosphoribosyltransferase